MTQYVDKSAIVAEIKRYKHKADERLKIKDRTLAEDCKDSALQNLCGNLLHFLNTLEVKEVDLEEKINEWLLRGNITDTRYDDYCDDDIIETAKHFFELGFKAAQNNN